MEDKENLSWEDVVRISENFPWEPGFNKVIVTLNREEPDGTLVLSDNTMSEEQFIIAKGPHVHTYDVCDTVLLDLEKLMVTRPNPNNQDEQLGQIKFTPIFDDDDNMYALIEDRYISARRINNKPLEINE